MTVAFHTRICTDLDEAEVEASLRSRIERLPESAENWQTRMERKALLWLVGEYRGNESGSNLTRTIRHRMVWLRNVVSRDPQWYKFQAVELAALEIALARRLEMGDYR